MVPRQEDEDEDDISLTSTVESEPKSEYEVEQVLAEQRFEDGVRYLVQWAGYPPERNSWEPADAFSDGQTILDWRRKNTDIAAGKCKSFDVDAWLQYMEDFEERREDRKRRREAKRRRLGASAGTSKAAQKTDSQRPLQKPLSRRHSSGPGVPAQRRVHQEVPPVLFGGGKPPQAHPQRRNSLHASTSMNSGKWFPNLSSKYWHQKARTKELDPVLDGLDLRRPSEWPENPPIAPTRATERISDIQPALVSDSAASGSYRNRSPEKLDENTTRVIEPGETRNKRGHEPFSGRPPRAKKIMTPSGLRLVGFGELLVRILYGPDKRIIGAARLCGLGSKIRGQLLRHKRGHSLDIWFQHVCTLDQYQTIAPNAMGRAYDVGWIEGYDDTTPDIRLMSQDLKQENTVAIYNFERVGLAFLAYPPDSLGFRDLSNLRKDIPDVYLHIHVRESLNSIEQLHHNAHVQKSTPRYPETEITGSAENLNRSDHLSITEGYEETKREFTRSMKDRTVTENASKRHLSPDQHVAEATVNGPSLPNLLEDINTDPSLPEPAGFEAMDIDHEGPPPALEQKKSLTDDELNLKNVFKKQFEVNFATLVKVNAGSKTQLAKVLYLMYPEDPIHAEEFQLLAEFLKHYNPVIYSSRYEGDWEKFARTVSNGVVFFHESFAAFHTLPFLKQLLGKSSVGFWSVSLVKPLQFADHPSHFQRIFPHGCVILMTEEFMVREQHGTIVLLAWMNDWMRKKIPGYWKMMFRPDVLNWVLQQHETSPQADQENWLTMYRLISQLCVPSAYDTASGEILSGSTDEYFESNAISPPKLQGYGSRTEKDNPDIPAGLSRAHLDADHLIEFFAGWALVNNHLYRRFVVVTSPGLKVPRWAEWNHIELKHGAREFIESFQIDYRYYWSKLTEKPGSQGGAKDHHSHQAASPYTPRTPGGLRAAPTEHKASRLTQIMNSASAQYNYPEPYQ
ncbi:putative Chromo domain protein Chp1p [Aspergillus fijiensis CBS 313.89]|uniref:Chromo domain-containing protein n=1 Tax=Aspergillus fijiensis CBS 313.89 TaxID=1448319 RepID=A0A8G1RNX9_9EURO|nr:uncharacterized protein BO72DRAFT_434369 [Aspergillus fijiensis CBS 313.89]RAK74876.1 hypothetical protein BO72DRAFT_434369 [Aspergillus fijiensis CBS 313.89]